LKPDKNLFTASKILERAQARRHNSIDRDCITNLPYFTMKEAPKSEIKEEKEEKDGLNSEKIEVLKEEGKTKKTSFVQHHFNPKSNITPYILLIALSIHGLFEGTALGVQKHLNDTVFLGIAIISHKWAESLTLGMSFTKSNTDKNTFLKMILLFTIFTPIGIISGMLLVKTSELVQGTFLAISAGTFLYVSASEVIVEEFAITKYRYQKYFLYLCGGILVGILSILEVKNLE
jgi:zinc transporter ZupT